LAFTVGAVPAPRAIASDQIARAAAGERVGNLAITVDDKRVAEAVDSQLKIIVRPMYSNPPTHGVRLVSHVLADAELKKLWEKEVKLMAERIIGMRTRLRARLLANGSTHNWDHVTKQIGMFCYSGLTEAQVCVCVLGDRPRRAHADAGAGRPADQRVPHLPDAQRPHLHGRRDVQERRLPGGRDARGDALAVSAPRQAGPRAAAGRTVGETCVLLF
jgi:hypothetical protein